MGNGLTRTEPVGYLEEKWHNWYSKLCGNRVSAFQKADVLERKSAVLYQLCHFTSKRLEEKWHNWYSTALFFYTYCIPTETILTLPHLLLFGVNPLTLNPCQVSDAFLKWFSKRACSTATLYSKDVKRNTPTQQPTIPWSSLLQ